VHTILTNNGFEFTDRCSGGVKNEATGNHAFDINRRINEAIQRKAKIQANSEQNSFHNHEERNEFMLRFVDNYN
jgi:hypothetical protein